MLKRVGIITLYKDTRNYGAALQAFALCKVINSFDCLSEQIQYDIHDTGESSRERNINKFKKIFIPKEVFNYTYRYIVSKIYNKICNIRQDKFREFLSNDIPHSKNYTKDTIFECIEDYQVFVTGSDQVWNFDWYNPYMFLSFVPSEKVKISYAASLGKRSFTKNQMEIMKKHFSSFNAISVREKDSVNILKSISPVPVHWTLDPTLLLSESDWNTLLSKSSIKDDNYVFCYFLSNDKQLRKLAEQYARIKKLRLLFIPHVEYFNSHDIFLQGKAIKDASPADFLKLIYKASYIFTDSFHCCALSCVFRKQFYAFPRKERKGMEARILSLVTIFNCKDRFINESSKNMMSHIQQLCDIDFNQSQNQYLKMKNKSLKYLEHSLQIENVY